MAWPGLAGQGVARQGRVFMNNHLWHFVQIGHTYPNPHQNKEDSDYNHQISPNLKTWDDVLQKLIIPLEWMGLNGFRKQLCLWMPFGNLKYAPYPNGAPADGKLRFDSFYLASQSNNSKVLNFYHKFDYFCEVLKEELHVQSIMLYTGSYVGLKNSFGSGLVSFREYLPLVRQSIASPLDRTVQRDSYGEALTPYFLGIDEGTKLDFNTTNFLEMMNRCVRNDQSVIALEGRLNTNTPGLDLINNGSFCNMVMARDIKEGTSMLPRDQIKGPMKFVLCTNIPSDFVGNPDQQRSDWTKTYLNSGDDVLVNIDSLIKTGFTI